MKLIVGIAFSIASFLAHSAYAESLRCKGDIIDIGDIKIDVLRKCGEPVLKDTYCKKIPIRIKQADGYWETLEQCENFDVWTYNPGKGQF